MKNSIYQKTITTACVFVLFFTAQAQCPTLVWSDEFNGTELDLTKWEPMIGDGCNYGICGWGNNELQYYKAENAVVSNGVLKILVKQEKTRAYNYSSARLRTKDLADFTFGRFEARIKLLEGQGLWPAFWMLSSNEPYGGWPQSGEIDIMELLGQEPEKVHGTIHYGQAYPNNSHQGTDFVLYNDSFQNGFHVFAIEWEPDEIRWYVDDILYQTLTSDDVAPERWPFDASNQMHFLLNVAVGGNWPGNPDETTPFPNQMEVDYVRVYDTYNPSISGNRLVPFEAAGEVYSINNAPGNSSFSWSVPEGATLASGAGTNSITVNWGDSGGNVQCDVTTDCITKTYSIDVTVEPSYAFDFSFENFDEPAAISFISATGTLTEVDNADPTGINTSARAAEYVRNSQEQYDVVAYSTSAIPDASLYSTGNKKFYMDIHTSAPLGTEILLQLENSSEATSSNYPTGRHSRYVGRITKNGEWERIEFDYLDAPDGGTSDTGVDNIIILFASNSFTGDTYHWDNFDSYTADDGTGSNNAPSVTVTNPADGATFTEQTSVNVVAEASDIDGSVVQVEFFVDGNSIGIDNSSPYEVDWTIGAGTFEVTAMATDDLGASTISSTVSVTGESSSATPETLHVESIVTGTVSVGQGNKKGQAIITVLDDLGNPVESANVTGTFSGTFNETISGTTGSDGKAELLTTTSAKGGVTVELCVDDVTHSTLIYSENENVITCSGSGARTGAGLNAENEIVSSIYPNPFQDYLILDFNLKRPSNIWIRVHNISGRMVFQRVAKDLSSGRQQLQLGLKDLEDGIYVIETIVNLKSHRLKVIKR